MYKQNLIWNNLQGLIYRKITTNQPTNQPTQECSILFWTNFWSSTTKQQPYARLPSISQNIQDEQERRSPHGVMAKVLNCGLEVSEFELQSLCCVHFQTNTLR